MTALDRDLLRALGDADAALPPPPGVEVTAERLAQLAARRLLRRVATALAATLLVGTGAVLGTLRGPADAATFAAELATLRADVARLQAQLQLHQADQARIRQDETAAARRRSLDSTLRCELAEARAAGALMHIPSVPETRR